MKAERLPKFLEGITTPRQYFDARFQNRQQCLNEYNNSKEAIEEYAKEQHLPGGNLIAVQMDQGVDIAHVVRGEKFTSVVEHLSNHLLNALIQHIIQSTAISMKARLDNVVYTWYYYWFLRYDNKSITGLTHNVCYQLEEMIKTILAKELTLYRTANTAEMVSALRMRLSSERLVNMGTNSLNKGINFRTC